MKLKQMSVRDGLTDGCLLSMVIAAMLPAQIGVSVVLLTLLVFIFAQLGLD